MLFSAVIYGTYQDHTTSQKYPTDGDDLSHETKQESIAQCDSDNVCCNPSLVLYNLRNGWKSHNKKKRYACMQTKKKKKI